jgi:hypothetical protein
METVTKSFLTTEAPLDSDGQGYFNSQPSLSGSDRELLAATRESRSNAGAMINSYLLVGQPHDSYIWTFGNLLLSGSGFCILSSGSRSGQELVDPGSSELVPSIKDRRFPLNMQLPADTLLNELVQESVEGLIMSSYPGFEVVEGAGGKELMMGGVELRR